MRADALAVAARIRIARVDRGGQAVDQAEQGIFQLRIGLGVLALVEKLAAPAS